MILDAFQQKVNECDKGYLDGKKMERDILRAALKEHEIGMEDVDAEEFREEEPIEEKGDKEIDES